MAYNQVLKEAERLYRLGFALHWLHPGSKRPVESGWTTGPRKDWKELVQTYAPGMNLGVRLGTPSKITDRGYLAVVDVDVKSTEAHHRVEAVRAAKEVLQGAVCPVVLSGRGNGSRHYYCVTEKPFKTYNPAQSQERVKVFMPSKKPSKKEQEELSEAEIHAGFRMSPAWEISLYSDGRQVVLPPSIHPDSKKPYVWKSQLISEEGLPLAKGFQALESALKPEKNSVAPVTSLTDFELAPVELAWLDISERVKQGIKTGAGVEDRSAFLLPASTALLSAGLSRNEILTVLTEPDTFLGACAYEHAKTKDRKRAANWLWKYTVKRVMEERSADLMFAKAAKIEPVKKLSEEEAKAQAEEIEKEMHWQDALDKTKDGRYKNTLNNCKAIIINSCECKKAVGRNEFAANDYYLCGTPWISKKGEAVVSHDIVRIKFYCAEKFGIEFSDNMIDQTLQQIADQNRYHPVRDWLRTLKWDGTPRIDTWLKDYAGAEAPEPYLSEVSRKFLVAMVARVLKPGVKFDTILILEGIQGTGKSTLLARLASGPWFTDAALNVGDKDSVLTIQSKWLIELGELSSMSKADLDLFKAFISQQTDRIRAPYGKRVEEYPRQSVFVGTTNLDEYLRDITGNRRFWTVKLTAPMIDFEGITRIRDQLFAEAVVMYEKGETLYLDDKGAEAQALLEQAKRLQSDEWLSTIAEAINSENFPRDGFEVRDVAKKLDQFGAHRLSPNDVHRITRCLKLLNCRTWRETTGHRRKLWKQFTAEEIQHKTDQEWENQRLKDLRNKSLERWKRQKERKRVQRRPSPSREAVDKNSPIELDFY